MQIYLDYSATTPPRQEVVRAMSEVFSQHWGNPSSLHSWGQRAALILEKARLQVSNLINASHPDSVVFTSGGTEANNLALLGVVRKYETPQHLIISSLEHSAIAAPVQFLQKHGWQVSRLAVNERGQVNPLDLKEAIRPNTVLISVIYGQSEVGTLQPISELGLIARSFGIPFHSDAVQVAGRLPLDVTSLPVDLLSLSSHKLYGPQGVGALYVREGLDLVPLCAGGGQERGLRSGTQAVAAIAGFGLAAELAVKDMDEETNRLLNLRDRLFAQLANCPYLIPTGDRFERLPHHVSFRIVAPEQTKRKEKVTGKTLVRELNLAGIGISSGSACHSGKVTPSPILLAMGCSEVEAMGGIRLTLGRETTGADIDWTAMVLQQILQRLLAF